MTQFTIDALGQYIAVRVLEEQPDVTIGHVIDKGDEVTLRLTEGDAICFSQHDTFCVNLGLLGGSVLLVHQSDVIAKRIEVSA
jgi:co-chaperonin GroES (HSP10)